MAAFHFFPDRAGVGLPVQQRDLHKAKLLIASLQGGAHLDNVFSRFCRRQKS